ncbi:RNA polymerase sigma factor [Rubripirellula reticaptiva]|uniref:RNA polymerase sigma factor SigD n=1 Tax=Rubripirellula reticaptiva TaxID=2528013 RepID=A0A5C6EW07_9BACT|nr:sigma-70 family RNA polymerase sigma factor [Rubripirellula reticaptiva]TWU51856.1 RNA polymerase sigma factor SigD [Rubripirellula reticaptiva]
MHQTLMLSPHPTDNDTTSPTLLFAIREGNAVAWQRLVRIYGPLVVGWCRRCGLQESDAFDVSQEVLLGVSESLDRFELRPIQTPGTGSFRGWLWTITRNKIADHQRRTAGKAQAGGGTGALQQILSLPDQSPETTEDVADLHLRLLGELKLSFNETTWTAFWRVAVEGDAAKDVADDLGISVWAIYKAKSRILAKLREHFGENLE